MKRHSVLLLILALFVATACGDDAAIVGPIDEDSGVHHPDGSTANVCGDGVAAGSELCDGLDLNGETCTSATHGVMTGGSLSCRTDCTFNVALCTGEDSGIDEDGGGLGGTGG